MASRPAARLPDRSPSLQPRLGEVAHGDGDEHRVPELAVQRRRGLVVGGGVGVVVEGAVSVAA